MNRNTKIVLLVSLFALVCLAILWGRWFPDNQELDGLTVLPQGELRDGPIGETGGEAYSYPTRRIVIGDPPRELGDRGHPGGPSVPGTPPITEVDPPDGPQQPAESRAGWRTHKVAKNDKLWSLAVLYLGDGTRYKEIVSANPDVNPKALKPGSVLKIPPRDRGGSTARVPDNPSPRSSGTASTPSGSRKYTVRSGDTLSGIAKRELGSEGKWSVLAELNGIKPPLYTIKPGDQLKLPSR